MRGTTNDLGLLVLRPVKPGKYKLTIRKVDYRDEEKAILVLPSGHTESITLEALPAHLNVTSSTPGARISILNVGEYTDRVMNLELAPGAYGIEITKPGYRTFTKRIVLAAAAPFFLPVTLEKMSMEEMISTAQQKIDSRKFVDAISLFNVVLSEQPGNIKVYKDLGRAYYLSGNYEQSVSYYAKALSAGDTLSFKVRHRHRLAEMCSGTLTVNSKTFAFKSDDGYKEGHDFEIPYSKFKEYTLVDDIEGVRLHTKARIPKSAGRKGEDEKDNNFYTPETSKPINFEPCADCAQRLRVILDLTKQFIGGG
jgi:tetratricopeptide (TPR) repeat protein